MRLTRKDYNIIQNLYLNGCINKLCAFSVYEIAKKNDCSIYKARASMSLFLALEIIEKGIKDGRKDTYFLSEKGLKMALDLLNDIDESMSIREENGVEC